VGCSAANFGPGMGLFELMRQEAEASANEPPPEPIQPEYARGSVEYNLQHGLA
jgi:hypothetical protein